MPKSSRQGIIFTFVIHQGTRKPVHISIQLVSKILVWLEKMPATICCFGIQSSNIGCDELRLYGHIILCMHFTWKLCTVILCHIPHFWLQLISMNKKNTAT